MSKSVDNNKNYSELTPSQKTFDRALKAIAITLLAVSILVCVLTTMKAIDLQAHKEWYSTGWGKNWKWVEAGPNYSTYMGIAIGTGMSVVPLFTLVICAFQRKVYPKDLRSDEMETLRRGNLGEIELLLFYDGKNGWSEKRIASLEAGVRNGQLTPQHIQFFDNETQVLHKKALELRNFEKNSAAKRDDNGNLPPLDSLSSKKMTADHAKMEQMIEEIARLTEKWTSKHKTLNHNGQLESGLKYN